MFKDKRKVHNFVITYKSGAQFVLRCYSLTVHHRGSEITSAEWEAAEDAPVWPFRLNIDNIESIWEQE